MKKILAVVLLVTLGCHHEKTVVANKVPGELAFFINSLVNNNTGLVSSRLDECFTTVYKNALATMVFLHEGNIEGAERIFDVFDAYYQNHQYALAFPQDWDACAGTPTNENYWEGDNAFLLLALNYYQITTGNNSRYHDMVTGLLNWLGERADSCDQIVAEGVANMYAALKPYESDSVISLKLVSLENCFNNSVDFPNVSDHMVRAALVFCNDTGFDYLNEFKRTDTWAADNMTSVTAYSAFKGESFINAEISAQILLTCKLYPAKSPIDPTLLESEMLKLLLHANNNSASSGLPYYVIVPSGVNWNPASLPILDPTCYLLFYYWSFNPFAPGKACT